MTQLRPYQQSAIEGMRAAMMRGVRRILLVAPTGSGKGTTIAFMIAEAVKRGKRVLFLVAGRQLVDEFSERLTKQFGVVHGVIMAGDHRSNPACPVQVASIDTIASMVRRKRALPRADLVILDEADLARATRFEEPLSHFPDAFIIGQTATPVRADGKGLGRPVGGVFDEMIVAVTPAELMNDGHLSSYEGFVFESMETAGLRKTSGGDYNAEKIYAELTNEKRERRAGDIVAKWLEFAGGRRTVGFAMTRDDSRDIVARFNAARAHGAPIARAEHVDGEMKWADRQAIIARVRTGETQIVVNVGVLGRGVDIPSLEVCAFYRPTASLALYLQQAGRVLRTSPETGKKGALFLDHVGNVARHGLVDDAREWSLADGIARRREGDEGPPPTTTCKGCQTLFISRKRVCPKCGRSAAPAPKQEALLPEEIEHVNVVPIREVAAARVEPVVAKKDPEGARLFTLVQLALREGRGPDWVAKVFARDNPRERPSEARINAIFRVVSERNEKTRQRLGAIGGRRG